MDIETVIQRNPYHKDKLESRIAEMLSKDDYKDVTFNVEGKTILCHKVILAKSCSFFDRMFKSELTASNTIDIKTMSHEMFNQIINFIYTGNVIFSENEAQNLLHIADMMDLIDLKDVMTDYFIEQMDSSNCLGFYNMAEVLTVERLKERALAYSIQNFREISMHDELLELPLSGLLKYLDEPTLNAVSEDEICSTGIRWILHKPKDRAQYLHDILNVIRLEHLTADFLHSKILMDPNLSERKEDMPFLQSLFKHLLFNVPCPTEVKSMFPRTRTKQLNGMAVIWQGPNFTKDNDTSSSTDEDTTKIKEMFTNVGFFAFLDTRKFAMQKVISNKTEKIFLKKEGTFNQVFVIDNCIYTPFAKESGNIRFSNGIYKYDISSSQLSSSVFPKLQKSDVVVLGGCKDTSYGVIFSAMIVNKVHKSIPCKFDFSAVSTYVLDKDIWINQSFPKSNTFTVVEGNYTSIMYNQCLYVFGVSFQKSKFIHVVMYDLNSNTLKLILTKLPQEINHMKSVVYRDIAVIAGSQKLYIIRLDRFNPSENKSGEDLEQLSKMSLVHKTEKTQNIENEKAITVSRMKGIKGKCFQMHIIGNQLIVIGGEVDKFKQTDIIAVNINSFLENGRDIEWEKVGEIPEGIGQDILTAAVNFSIEQ